VIARRLRGWIASLRATPLHPQWLHCSPRDALPEADSLPAGLLLDIGCADRWLRSRLRTGIAYVAVDYPAVGGSRYSARPDVFGDVQGLPVRDAVCDSVALLEVLEHVPDPDRALSEIFRVLRPGGSLLLSAPFAYPLHDQPYDFRRFTNHGLRWMLERHGFRVTSMRATTSGVAAAAVCLNLAIAAAAVASWERRSLGLLWTLPALLVVPLVNVCAWFASRIGPDAGVFTSGYVALASRPAVA
jgi:SAM-dependent methyltransferase